ncbi:type-F conjugative transfer system secretin TraK [Burkholderia plantarii]|uniref:type-F conjugative transfer system secretin TraK n=1 Tax=Burkholderia plantarii TaxID=41899 RepID=UPI0006D8B867|nr:type-F conjugative transfer system secretin TraK [Burkholderia plantarii]ALK35183.1 conjugal transfer protein TraK [Burkholderia plantarii]WLE64142.1 type-F conjugative transfer system secretin TraK [Burkholderia plantarii]GLZ22527.1 hypothetical protein Bpla01_60560 [Burkholderia plantarii]
MKASHLRCRGIARLVFPLVVPLAALLVAGPAKAISLVKGADRQAQQVAVSAAEYNLLTMSGGRQITKVVPTVPGSLSWTQAGSQFWFKPSNPSALNETITLFVFDDAGVSYRLTLVPGPRPAEDVRIEPPASRTSRALRASAFQRHVKLLMLAMSGAQSAPQVAYTSVETAVPLWKEATLTRVREYSDGDLVGETYTLANTSHNDLTLDERELYAPGVLAVAIEDTSLPAGASTIVYVVRERGEHD